MDILDTLWQVWNNDPALMNSISGIVTMVLIGGFGIFSKTKKKEHDIKIEVGDVKQIIPVVNEIVKQMDKLANRLDALDGKVDRQSDMFYTTFNNTKLGAGAKDKLKEQYFNLRSLTDKLFSQEPVKEIEEPEVIVEEEVQEIEDIYNTFKGIDTHEEEISN